MKRRISEAYIGILYLLSACSVGCAGTSIPPKAISDARAVLAKTDAPIRRIDERLIALQPVLIAACTGVHPMLGPDMCSPARDALDEIAIDFKGLAESLSFVDTALGFMESVQ